MSEDTKWDTVPLAAERTFRRLRNDVAWVHFAWENFLALYGSKERVNLLNRTASTFFAQLQEYYIGGIVLAVTRLMDPALTPKWANHSLETFIEFIDVPERARHVASLRRRLKRLKKLHRPFRKMRDKRFSHTSAKHLDAKFRLPRPTAMLRALGQFMDATQWYFEGRRTHYPLETSPGTSGASLIWHLRSADEKGLLRSRTPAKRRLKG